MVQVGKNSKKKQHGLRLPRNRSRSPSSGNSYSSSPTNRPKFVLTRHRLQLLLMIAVPVTLFFPLILLKLFGGSNDEDSMDAIETTSNNHDNNNDNDVGRKGRHKRRSIQEQIKRDLESIKRDSKIYYAESLEDEICAEKLYLDWNPEFRKLVNEGKYKTGKEHYIKEGYKDNNVIYNCPNYECRKNPDSCKCDKESVYLQRYPDIAQAVASGGLPSGTHHYENGGNKEGRIFSCHLQNLGDGIGTTSDCYDVFQRFMDATAPVVLSWPFLGDDKGWFESFNKAVVIIDGRDHPNMDYVIRNHRHFTGPDWMFYLITPPHVAKRWRKVYEGPGVKVIDLPLVFGNLTRYPDEYNDLLRSDFLWKSIVKEENVLISQTDALLLRHGVEEFFDFAYVGGPIFAESFATVDWRVLCATTIFCGGNGGLSFRRRSYMINALDHCTISMDEYTEDVWYSYCMNEFYSKDNTSILLPHQYVSNRFSIGSTCDIDRPVGMHKMWEVCAASSCVDAIITSDLFEELYGDGIYDPNDYCPEGEFYYMYKHKKVHEYKQTGRIQNVWKYIKDDYGPKLDYPCFKQLTAPKK